jgi:hypothetical protein
MDSKYETFLAQQNDRLKFYNQDFWETAKFFSALALLLLSGPVPVWVKFPRPANWSIVAAGAPFLAVIVSFAAIEILKRTAETYYEIGASVVILEGLLKLHVFEDSQENRGTRVVSMKRVGQAQKCTDQLANEFKRRLGLFKSSRMSWILKLFWAYFTVASIETVVLLLHGLGGINVVSIVKELL